LARLSPAVERALRESSLRYSKAKSESVHQGGYERVSISLVNPGTNTLRSQASAGSGTGHEGDADPVKLDSGRLGQLLAADRGDGGSTVVVFDVQKLGAINDTLGRYVGDRLIEGMAARLKQTFLDPDRLAYFGGGTFAVMLEGGTPKSDTARILQNPAAQAFVEPFKIDGQELRPTIRSGVAFHPADGVNADALVQNAEAALKAAREDGEKYMLFGLVTQRPTSRSLALEARLAEALERQEFLLHYQPKINIATGAVEGLEALLR
jgi:diguanylate cyclase (GGDEF)-like protein